MKKVFLLTLSLSALGSGLVAHAEIQPGLTVIKRIRGNDNRGKFSIQYVQLTRKLTNRAIRNKLNTSLLKEAKRYICDADPKRRKNMESNLAPKVTFANQEALAITSSYDFYCGGPYPDAGIRTSFYDLRSGEKVAIEDQVRDLKVFKHLVVEKMLANIPPDMEGCKDYYTDEQLLDNDLKFEVKEGKLVASQDYAHVARACEYDTDIFFADVKSFVKEGSTLACIIKYKSGEGQLRSLKPT
ncbi:MAG: hypothetical protein HY466_07035 [Deltaproteobacteria bacterium]|nr:hypothetical protein [Deltaproteobacteria bacterium]